MIAEMMSAHSQRKDDLSTDVVRRGPATTSATHFDDLMLILGLFERLQMLFTIFGQL